MELNRRNFLKGCVAAGGTALATSMMGCAAQPSSSKETSQTSSSQDSSVPSYRRKPEPIAEKDIAETLEADIVIVGAGNSGVVAATTAAELGASVIVLQKCKDVFSHGTCFSALNTKKCTEAGVHEDGWEVMDKLNRGAGNNLAKPEVIRNWVNYSGEMGDWIIDIIDDREECGGPIVLETPEHPFGMLSWEAEDEWNWHRATTHLAFGNKLEGGSIHQVIQTLADHACEVGDVQFLFNTPGYMLEQDDSGKVTGAYGKREDGSFVLCKAKKGVILAAGGYEQNDDMRNEFLPMANGLASAYYRPNVTTGDGLMMGLWAGGVMQKSPHSSNIHYDPGINSGTSMPFLRVNKNGERFSNEDVPYEQTWAQDVRQPGCCHYQIFDANYKTDAKEKMDPGMTLHGDWDTLVEDNMDSGEIFVADTLEELAKAIGVPEDTFVKTVKRYNELCDYNGDFEPDFGKSTKRMTKVEKAPFYAIIRAPHALTTLAGLEINGDFQVLGEDEKPIEGLWAVGNCSGNFFGGLYQLMGVAGMGVGRAFLSGRIAAKRICGVTD